MTTATIPVRDEPITFGSAAELSAALHEQDYIADTDLADRKSVV